MKKSFENLFDLVSDVGSLPYGGCTRLAFTENEDKMHEIFRNEGKKNGFRVWEDSVGNSYVANFDEGTKDYTLIGSHLDSVIEGGLYDGVCGVFCGLVILLKLKENHINIPVCVVAFRCEESSGYKICTVGSGIITDTIEPEIIARAKNKKGEYLLDKIKEHGYIPNQKFELYPKEYIELHIEQGRVLESENSDIGIVSAIASPYRYILELNGLAEHSGATPMNIRRDSLCAAAEIILAIEKAGITESKYDSVATVGSVDNSPNIMNAVPGKTILQIDIRGINEDSILRIVDTMKQNISDICAKRNIDYALSVADIKHPCILDKSLQEDLSYSAEKLGLKYKNMPSGAGHDAMSFVGLCKTGMVFIPCKGGISHNIAEHTEISQIINGTNVIYNYLAEPKN